MKHGSYWTVCRKNWVTGTQVCAKQAVLHFVKALDTVSQLEDVACMKDGDHQPLIF